MAQAQAAMNFTNVRKGMRARVVNINSSSIESRRLQEMGLTEGTEFTVEKVAPFGDPVEIKLRGYRLCLRKQETAHIEIELAE
jgi:Fe2+ transport system protein FeoA